MRNDCASLWYLVCYEFTFFSLYLLSYFWKSYFSRGDSHPLCQFIRAQSPSGGFKTCHLLEVLSLDNLLIHSTHLCEQQCVFADYNKSSYSLLFLVYQVEKLNHPFINNFLKIGHHWGTRFMRKPAIFFSGKVMGIILHYSCNFKN